VPRGKKRDSLGEWAHNRIVVQTTNHAVIPNSGGQDMKSVSLKMAKELDKQVRIWAAFLDLNRSAFIRSAIEEKIEGLKTNMGSVQPGLRVTANSAMTDTPLPGASVQAKNSIAVSDGDSTEAE
jgi:hypothetical protein